MPTKVYSANEVSVIFSGIPIDSGRGDDEFVAITQPEDTFTEKAGVDGEVTRSENRGASKIRRITLTLMRTSRGNAALSVIHNLDLKTPGGAGIAPLMIRDRQGASLFVAAEAWIVKFPDDVYAKEAGTVQWVIAAASPEQVIGGN